jgi:putative oxidoreductase
MSLQSDTNPSSHAMLSYTDGFATLWQDFLVLVGRVMIGWIFLFYGWGKLFSIAAYSKSFPGRGLAEWMAYVAVPVEFLGGLALVLGIGTRYVVLVMLFFMVVASFSSHAYWSVPDAQRGNQGAHFWKNITIIGGLILLFATAGGRFSLDRILFRKR